MNSQQLTLYAGDQRMAPWRIDSGSIDVIGTFWVSDTPPQSIDLDGDGPGAISQDLTAKVTAGTRYKLTFQYSKHPSLGSSPATATVSFGSYSATFTYNFGSTSKSNMNWKPWVATVVAPSGPAILSFASNDPKNKNYGIAIDTVSLVAADPVPISVSFDSTAPFVYNTTRTATAASAGTGAITFAVTSSSGTCSIQSTTATTATVKATSGTGTCTVTATQAPDGTYNQGSASASLNLAKADQTGVAVAFDTSDFPYGTTRAATASGGQSTGGFTYGTIGGCSVQGSPTTSPAVILATSAAGTCAVTATKAGDANYNDLTATSGNANLKQGTQAGLAVTFDSLALFVYGTTRTATASGGSGTGAITFAVTSPSGTCSIQSFTATTATVRADSGAGECTVTATKAGDANYLPTSGSVTLMLAPADQAALGVTFDAPAPFVYNTTRTATASGGSGTGAITFAPNAGCTLSNPTATAVTVTAASGTGTCTVTATKAADTNYNKATASASQTLAKADQSPITNFTVAPSTLYVNGQPGTASASGGSDTGNPITFGAGSSTGCTVSGTTVTLTDPTGTCVVVATKLGNANYNDVNASFTVTLKAAIATPVLIRPVAAGDTGEVDLIGRVDGAPQVELKLEVWAASACTNGVLVGGAPAGDLTSLLIQNPNNQNPDGYFGLHVADTVSGIPIPRNAWVAIRLTSPSTTGFSQCQLNSDGNDTWPRARHLVPGASAASLHSDDYIDAPGRGRWYKFDVMPGQRITVNLSKLPADYDLAVFKDIGATFCQLLGTSTAAHDFCAALGLPTGEVTSTAQLTKLSAEYAPFGLSPMGLSPMGLSPSSVAPDAYSTEAFAPFGFAADVFAPFGFAPFGFAPFGYSSSALSPFGFAPFGFAPFGFAPFGFAPFGFAPFGFAPTELAAVFSSAQTRSIIGVSVTPGPGDELVIVNSWNNAGSFYIRVGGHGSAYSTAPDGQYSIDVSLGPTSCYITQSAAPRLAVAQTGIETLILTDSSAIPDYAATVAPKVASLVARLGSTNTVVVDVANDTSVQNLKAQAYAVGTRPDGTQYDNRACPTAMNIVAEEIKGIVDSYRPSNGSTLRYVAILGNDDAIPFFRKPDISMFGEESGYVPPVRTETPSDASLRNNYVLTQDPYGSATSYSLGADTFPVPDLAVGRLVESAADIAGMIDAYLTNDAYMTNGVVSPHSSLVTGYDFLADAANAVAYELGQGTGATADTLITPNNVSPQYTAAKYPPPTYQPPYSWTAVDLATKLFNSGRHDVIFLAGHFSAQGALAADFESSLTTDDLNIADPSLFRNAILFSAGCHSGYNLVNAAAIPFVTDPLDWAETAARKRITLIAGTGYQYGDTDVIELSERLYLNFSQQLRAGTGPVAVGTALMKAKQAYIAQTPTMLTGVHQKALLEATLFGLPMLKVDMPQGRGQTFDGVAGGAIQPVAVATNPGAITGLQTAQITFTQADLALSEKSVPFTVLEPQGTGVATYLSPADGKVIANPLDPVLPLIVRNVTPGKPDPNHPGQLLPDPSLVVRGIGWLGGAYTDSVTIPLTAASTTDLRGAHVSVVWPVFLPTHLAEVNRTGAMADPAGNATSLVVTPVQHRGAAIPQSVRRQYTELTYRVYMNGSYTYPSSLADAPTIVNVIALPVGSGVEFTVQVTGDPSAGVQHVWVVYTDTSGLQRWTPLDLAQCIDPLPAGCTAVDSSIWKAQLPSVPPNLRYIAQAANGYGLVTFDDNRALYYRLGGVDPAATTLAFASPPEASKNYGDNVTVSATLSAQGGAPVGGKDIIFAVGGSAQIGTTDGNGVAQATLRLSTLPGKYKVIASFAGDDGLLGSATGADFTVNKAPTNLDVAVTATGVEATLTATLGPKQQPLLQESVRFTLRNPTTNAIVKELYSDGTDFLGQTSMPVPGVAEGGYKVTASWPAYNNVDNPTYLPATSTPKDYTAAHQSITFTGLPGQPPSITYPSSVNFTVASQSGNPVTLSLQSSTNPGCTLTKNADGTYTLTATKAGGDCTLVASSAGTIVYAPVTVTQAVTIAKAQITVAATLSPTNTYTYGDDVASPVITYGYTLSGTLSCLLNQSPGPTFTSTPSLPSVPPAPANTYSITGAFASGQIDPNCIQNTVSAPLTVSQAQAKFSNVVVSPAAGGPALSITGNLNRDTKSSIYPTGSDLGATNSAFAIALSNGTSTVKTYYPTQTAPLGASGAFTVTDNTLPSGSYTATLSYIGGPNFLAATAVSGALLIENYVTTLAMAQARAGHTSTLLADGRVLAAGGNDATGAPTATSEVFCPDSMVNPTTQQCPNGKGKWSAAGNMPSKAAFFTTNLLPNGKAIQIGGGNSSSSIFDPATNQWSPGGGVGQRSYHTATYIPSINKVFVVGGADNSGKTNNSTLLIDATTGVITNGPTLLATGGRERHTATLLSNGKVLIAGGRQKSGSNYVVLNSTEVYNPANNTLTAGPTMTGKRFSHAAEALTDGRVVLAGGSSDTTATVSGSLTTVEIYVPSTTIGSFQSFTTPPVLQQARREFTMTRMNDGRLLAVAGVNATQRLKSTEIFTSTTNTFALGADLVPPPADPSRSSHAASLLKDGRVLVSGGTGAPLATGVAINSAELYGVCTSAPSATPPVVCP